MKNNQKINKRFKTIAGLTAILVLISIFIPLNQISKAGNITCLSISKLSRNITQGSSWAETTNAEPSQKVAFSIQVTAADNASINKVSLDDDLSDKLTYISNSTKIDNVSTSDGLIDGGIDIGSFSPGQTKTITFEANIADEDQFPVGQTSLSNTAGAWAVCSAKITDNAEIVVFKQEPSNPSLSIQKQVRNVSQGTGFSDLVNAEPGDEVEFSLEIHSTGNTTANNVKVWDDLPSRLDYIYGSTQVDGSYKSNNITSGGIYIDDLASGQSRTIKFRARIASEDEFYSQTTDLTNYGYTQADNVSSLYGTARVRVEKEEERPDLNIDKLVRNISRGYTSWTNTVYANPEDEIEFLIKVHSTGDAIAKNVRVRDSLPSRLEYISDSTKVDGVYRSDDIISISGIYVGDLSVDQVREIKFKARVAERTRFYSSVTTLTNEAVTWASDVSRIRDYAYVKVEKEEETETQAISINKLGRNISRGQTAWLDSVLASPSQEIEFSVQVSNIGNADLNNVKVWDTLPVNLSIITNSTTVNGISWGGDVTGGGLDLGTLNQGVTKTIKFRAMIAGEDNFGAGSTTLINTAYTKADDVAQISDQALVIVTKSGQVKGVELPPTGANLIALIFLAIISAFLAFIVYCRVREDKVLDILNSDKKKFLKAFAKLYFRIKFFFTITKMRFKRVYW